MRPPPESSTQEVLAGLVERVTYHNSENGFCVLRAKVRGHRDVVTVVGHAATIAAGEWIRSPKRSRQRAFARAIPIRRTITVPSRHSQLGDGYVCSRQNETVKEKTKEQPADQCGNDAVF
jgi:hypothetical protein